jgi:hypothetical protein
MDLIADPPPPAGTTIEAHTDLTGWIPTRVEHTGNEIGISWCWAEGARFEEPFWTDTVQRLMADPFRLIFQHLGSVADLHRHADTHDAIKPNGFVYHLSRSGSTLVGRALGSLAGVRVLSEPGPLDQMLRAMSDRPFDRQVSAARSMLHALAPVHSAENRSLVVKLDAWHIHFFPVLRAAFPDVPWIFLSRNPVEVMVSHEGQRAAQMIPTTLPRNLLQVPEGDLNLTEYGAHVLAAILRSAVRYQPDGAMFVDYTELPDALTARIAPLFGLIGVPTVEVLTANAKHPATIFEADSATKRLVASESMRLTTAAIIGDAHAAFEAIRLGQLAG